MKFCKDCKHYAGKQASPECTARGNFKPDYVGDGKPNAIWETAANCRTYRDSCGEDAKWFEEKTQ